MPYRYPIACRNERRSNVFMVRTAIGGHAMCPMCVTTTVLMAAAATSGAGVIGLITSCRRALHRWLLRLCIEFQSNSQRGA